MRKVKTKTKNKNNTETTKEKFKKTKASSSMSQLLILQLAYSGQSTSFTHDDVVLCSVTSLMLSLSPPKEFLDAFPTKCAPNDVEYCRHKSFGEFTGPV